VIFVLLRNEVNKGFRLRNHPFFGLSLSANQPAQLNIRVLFPPLSICECSLTFYAFGEFVSGLKLADFIPQLPDAFGNIEHGGNIA
jgi:hypothetical protein